MINSNPELLDRLTADQVRRTLALGSRITIAAGSELFHLGSDADRVFIVERGRILLTLPMNVRGREQNVVVEERVPGQTVGWSALIPPYRFTLSATAPLETEVVALSREALAELFAADPDVGCAVAFNLAVVIGQRLVLFQTMWLREMQRTLELRCA